MLNGRLILSCIPRLIIIPILKVNRLQLLLPLEPLLILPHEPASPTSPHSDLPPYRKVSLLHLDILQFVNTDDVRSYFDTPEGEDLLLNSEDSMRIISNHAVFDAKENKFSAVGAGEELLRWLRGQRINIPFFVYCGNYTYPFALEMVGKTNCAAASKKHMDCLQFILAPTITAETQIGPSKLMFK